MVWERYIMTIMMMMKGGNLGFLVSLLDRMGWDWWARVMMDGWVVQYYYRKRRFGGRLEHRLLNLFVGDIIRQTLFLIPRPRASGIEGCRELNRSVMLMGHVIKRPDSELLCP